MKNSYAISLEADMRSLRNFISGFNEVASRVMRRLDLQSDAAGYCKRPKVLLIQEVIASHYEVPITAMTSKLRPAVFVEPRQVAMYLSRDLTKYGLQDIGKCFNRDHGTIIHACEAIVGRLAADHAFANQMAALRVACLNKMKTTDLEPPTAVSA